MDLDGLGLDLLPDWIWLLWEWIWVLSDRIRVLWELICILGVDVSALEVGLGALGVHPGMDLEGLAMDLGIGLGNSSLRYFRGVKNRSLTLQRTGSELSCTWNEMRLSAVGSVAPQVTQVGEKASMILH